MMKNPLAYKITFRTTKSEREYLEECAKEDGVCLSKFVRDVLLDLTGYRSILISNQVRQLRQEIRRIGVNINQVAKKINGGYGTAADIVELLSELERVQNLFDEYKEKVDGTWQSRR
ncbi:MAG: MobC family plasmid mobilization relaxosome protein [Agathobacter sp.]